jgi:hypothetical protein
MCWRPWRAASYLVGEIVQIQIGELSSEINNWLHLLRLG